MYGVVPISKLTSQLGVSYGTIERKAKEMGLSRHIVCSEGWTPHEEALLLHHFEYAPKRMIERLLPNRTWAAIYYRGRTIHKLRRLSQDRYSVDYKFFSQWTQESTYVIGFIAADGYIEYGSRNFLQIELQGRDYTLLKQIQTVMCYEGKVALEKRGTSKLYISNRKIVEDLMAKGIPGDDKTFTLQFPKDLPSHMLRHFLRGLLDGDGSIIRHGKLVRIVFLGTEALLIAIKDKFHVNNKIAHKGKEGRGVYSLAISGKKAVKILDWLYEDATIFLERKYDKYLKLTAKEHAIMEQNKQGKYTSSNYFISSLSPKRTALLMRTQTQLPLSKPVELKLELCNEQDVRKTKAALEEMVDVLDEALFEYKVTAKTLSLVAEATKKYQGKFEKVAEVVEAKQQTLLDFTF